VKTAEGGKKRVSHRLYEGDVVPTAAVTENETKRRRTGKTHSSKENGGKFDLDEEQKTIIKINIQEVKNEKQTSHPNVTDCNWLWS